MKYSYIIIIMCAFLFTEQKALGENVTQTVHFSYLELKCDTVTGEDGLMYNLLLYSGMVNEGDLGYPTLPKKEISIPVPYSAENISLSAERRNITSQHIPYKISPAQMDIPTLLGNYERAFIPCDSVIYNSSLPFPSFCARIVSVPCIGKDKRSVRVELSPITYYPTSDLIEFAEEIDITVSYTISSNARTGNNNRSYTANDIGIPFYEYCIITRDSLKHSFERLVAWRKQNGLNAGVVCLEDILNNPYIVGDTVSNIYDNAGKLRQYLQYAYDSGTTKYVLFGGNAQILPIRYGTGDNNCWTHDENNDYKIPSDFYFCELNSNWNTDNDKYYGEPCDNLNYGGQLYVGRVLCTNSTEVENYTNKLLRYELCPGNGDTSYLTKVFFQQSDQMQNYGEAQSVAGALGGNFTTIKIVEETPAPYDSITVSPYGKDVIDSMRVNYGYVNLYGHGQPYAIAVKTNSRYYNGYGWDHNCDSCCCITSTDEAKVYVQDIIHEDGNSLTCLDNKDYPMFAYSISCTITPFDLFHSISEIPNMGQSFTLGKDYGGPVLVGNTRYGFTLSSHYYHKKFNNYIINEPVGKSLLFARASYCSSSVNPHFLAHSSNLIGCPFIQLWTDIPNLFNASLSYNANSYVIDANNSIEDAFICIRDITQANEVTETISFNPSLGAKILPNVDNSLISLTGKNCLPQILPLTIQNDTLQGNHYAIVKDVVCGKDVRNGNQGNVIFDEGSDYTFETNGKFKLTKGVKIKQGAKFKVTPSEINY